MLASDPFRRRSGQIRRDLPSTSTVDFGRCNGAQNLGVFILIARYVLVGSARKIRAGDRIQPVWISCFQIPFARVAY